MNKVPVSMYLVVLVATFLYGLAKYFFPDLPLTLDQIQFIIIAVLALFGVDVSVALRTRGTLK